MLKEYSEVAINIVKVNSQGIIIAGMPSLTHIKGPDPQQQWYLYEQINPFCKSFPAAHLYVHYHCTQNLDRNHQPAFPYY